MKIKYIILFIIVFAIGRINAQNFTLYNMKGVVQSFNVNPSAIPLSLFNLGIPVISSVNLNISNSGFAYSDVIVKKADDSLHLDINNLIASLAKNNYLNTSLHVELFNLGFKVKKSYFSINATEKIDLSFAYPKDFIELLGKGNGGLIGKEASFNFGLNFSHYREYAFGYAGEINDHLTIGGKLKYLYGMENVNTTKSDLSLYTSSDFSSMSAKADILINTSGANPNAFKNFNPTNYLTKKDNKGFGADLGATFKLDDKLSFSASVLDLGYINWNEDTRNYKSRNPGSGFTFNGVNYSQFSDTGFAAKMTDSVSRSFNIDTLKGSYKTWLPAQIYVGGRFQLSEKQNVGLLLYSQIFNKEVHPGFSLSYSAQLGDFLNASVSYSMVNRSYSNIGFGLALKPGPVQLYVVTDNILCAIVPQHTKNLNIRFGLNLVFGGGDDDDDDHDVDSKPEKKEKKVEKKSTSTPAPTPKSGKPAKAPKPVSTPKPKVSKKDDNPRPEGAPTKVNTPPLKENVPPPMKESAPKKEVTKPK